MKIVVTGASGFVGKAVSERFLEQGHLVTGLGRSATHRLSGTDGFTWVPADTTREGSWQEAVSRADLVVNLAGQTIFGYWTKAYRQQIYDSRVLTTRNVVNALDRENPGLLISASAIGYYGDRGEDPVTEIEQPGGDFLARVCVDWEAEASRAENKGFRVVIMRFGVVLGKHGGALEKMLPAFKAFAGGPLGRGVHWFPWIHLQDLLSSVSFAISAKDVSGPVNVCAPGAVRHKTFARALGRVMGRPSFMPAPSFMIRLVMGEMGSALMSSQKAVPAILESNGFAYEFPDIDSALQDLVG